MTDLPLPPTATLRHRHTVGFPELPRARAAIITLAGVLGALLGAIWASGVASAAAVSGARSVILVGGGLACIPVALAGLVGVWWAVLVGGPLLILFDYLLGPSEG